MGIFKSGKPNIYDDNEGTKKLTSPKKSSKTPTKTGCTTHPYSPKARCSECSK